jgi:hypothetical protein
VRTAAKGTKHKPVEASKANKGRKLATPRDGSKKAVILALFNRIVAQP